MHTLKTGFISPLWLLIVFAFCLTPVIVPCDSSASVAGCAVQKPYAPIFFLPFQTVLVGGIPFCQDYEGQWQLAPSAQVASA